MLDTVHSDPSARPGLSADEARRRLAESGPNEITREAGKPVWRLLVSQFSSPVVLLLLAACLLAASLGEIADAIAIGGIVIVNALVGFFQEYRAERAVLALRSMTAPRARVLCALAVFMWALEARGVGEARNLAFSVLVFGELLRAFSARDPDRLIWEVGLFSNLRLFFIVLISILVQLGIHHIPATQELFGIGPLTLADCVLSVLIGLVPFVVLELIKLLRRMARLPRD